MLLISMMSKQSHAQATNDEGKNRCNDLTALMIEVQERELSLVGKCKIDGKQKSCSLREMQQRYDSLQAQNVIYAGVLNLISTMSHKIRTLSDADKLLKDQVSNLGDIESGAKIYSSIQSFVENETKLNELFPNSESEKSFDNMALTSALKTKFCKDPKENTDEKDHRLCAVLASPPSTDGEQNPALDSVLSYVRNYTKLAPQTRSKVGVNVKKILNENQVMFNSIPLERIASLKTNALQLSNELSCIKKRSDESKIGTGTQLPSKDAKLSKPVFIFNPSNPNDLNALSECDLNVSLEDAKNNFKLNLKSYQDTLSVESKKITDTKSAEIKVFDLLASGETPMVDKKIWKLDSSNVCFSKGCGSIEGLSKEEMTTDKEEDYKNYYNHLGLANNESVEDFNKYNNMKIFLDKKGVECPKADQVKCYYEQVAIELNSLCGLTNSKLSAEDIPSSHLKVNKCVNSIDKQDLTKKWDNNRNEIQALKASLDEFYKIPEYKDTSFLKKQILKAWNKDKACGNQSYSEIHEQVGFNSCDPNHRQLDNISQFVDANGKILLLTSSKYSQDQDFHEMNNDGTIKTHYKLNNKTFCNVNYMPKENSKLSQFCKDDFKFDGNTYGKSSSNEETDDSPNTNFPGKKVEEKKVADIGATEDINTGGRHKNGHSQGRGGRQNNNSDSGKESVGSNILSGLLGLIPYGMQIMNNTSQNNYNNQQWMQRQLMVKNAQLYGGTLSRNPQSPNSYNQRTFSTGMPLGYSNPFSTNFNYNNNAFYYNTYDPLKASTTSTNSSTNNNNAFNFSR